MRTEIIPISFEKEKEIKYCYFSSCDSNNNRLFGLVPKIFVVSIIGIGIFVGYRIRKNLINN